MSLVRLNIKGISYSQTQSGAYALVLSEEDGERTLPIIIGAFEAQSIAIALEKEIKPPRPLTHDLFKSFADRFNIVVKQVIIHKLVDGVFYSSLICECDKIEEIIDAMARGDRVELRGFGAFSVKKRDARVGRNPRTGETVQVEEKHVPFFKTGKLLRDRLNGK